MRVSQYTFELNQILLKQIYFPYEVNDIVLFYDLTVA